MTADGESGERPPPDGRLLLPAVACWGVMVAAGRAAWPHTALLAGVLVGSAGGVALIARSRKTATARAGVLCLVTAAAGAACLAVSQWTVATGPLPHWAGAGASVSASVTVSGDPVLHPGRVVGQDRSRDLVTVPATLRTVRRADEVVRTRQPVLLLATAGAVPTDLLPGQLLTCDGTLLAARPGQHLVAVVRLAGPVVAVGRPGAVERAAGALREGLRRASAGLPPAEAGLLPGLVVGDTSALDPGVRAAFTSTGMTHLVAVSGGNTVVVLAVALGAAAALRLPPVARAVLGASTLAGFVVLARPSPSVLRAAGAGALLLGALAYGRPVRPLAGLAATVTLLLWLDPPLATSPGFALSAVATAGILTLVPGWSAALGRRLPRRLAQAVAVPAAAQLACGPLIAALWGTVSLVAVPANLLAMPVVPVATVLGVGAAIVAPVAPTAAHGLAQLAGLPCRWLVTVATRGAQVPGGGVAWPVGLVGAVLLGGLSVLLVALAWRRVGRRVLAAAAAATVLAGMLVVPGLRGPWPGAGWVLAFCDVGQGDAEVLADRAGHAVLVDGGPDPAPLAACLSRLGIHRLDAVVLSHAHADHVEGLPAVLGRLPVGRVLVGPTPPAGAAELGRVRGWARLARVPVESIALGSQLSIGGIRAAVVGPDRLLTGTDSDLNNSSLAMLVRLPGLTALLAGDVETEEQAALLGRPGVVAELAADVVKVPHHGSAKQEAAFLPATGARATVASVGEGNPYGHPAAVTMARARALGPALRTDEDGSVVVRRSGGRVELLASHPHRTVVPGTAGSRRTRTAAARLLCGPVRPPSAVPTAVLDVPAALDGPVGAGGAVSCAPRRIRGRADAVPARVGVAA
ncbi:MAG: putative Competence protein [Mycobacterium sp.]|nr:putative Competence protein [Mycobacterium sp.]